MLEETMSSSEPDDKPRQRGRPRKNGVRPGDFLVRGCFALETYNAARRSGEKHESALAIAARSQHISVTEVKRVLAELQPKKAFVAVSTYESFRIDKDEMKRREDMGLPEVFWKNPIVLPVGISEPPVRPRINARPSEDSKEG